MFWARAQRFFWEVKKVCETSRHPIGKFHWPTKEYIYHFYAQIRVNIQMTFQKEKKQNNYTENPVVRKGNVPTTPSPIRVGM